MRSSSRMCAGASRTGRWCAHRTRCHIMPGRGRGWVGQEHGQLGAGCADTRVLFLSAAGPDGRPEEGATERDRGLRGRQGPPAVPHHQGRGAPRHARRSGTTKLFMPSGQTLWARFVDTCIASLACVSSEDFLGSPPWRLCIHVPSWRAAQSLSRGLGWLGRPRATPCCRPALRASAA